MANNKTITKQRTRHKQDNTISVFMTFCERLKEQSGSLDELFSKDWFTLQLTVHYKMSLVDAEKKFMRAFQAGIIVPKMGVVNNQGYQLFEIPSNVRRMANYILHGDWVN